MEDSEGLLEKCDVGEWLGYWTHVWCMEGLLDTCNGVYGEGYWGHAIVWSGRLLETCNGEEWVLLATCNGGEWGHYCRNVMERKGYTEVM